jgi:hypothetical protein
MSLACCMYEREEECIQVFDGKARRKESDKKT